MFKTLCQINHASNILQRIDIDLSDATSVLRNTITYISALREQDAYNDIKSEAITLAIKWNISI